MGQETGKVIRIENQQATVQMRSSEQCHVCAAKSACSFNGPESAYRYMTVPLQKGIREGDVVSLEYRGRSRIFSALIVFLLPILLILAGYFLTDYFFRTANSGMWGAIGGFLLSVPVLYGLNRLLERSRFLVPGMAKKRETSKRQFYQKTQATKLRDNTRGGNHVYP